MYDIFEYEDRFAQHSHIISDLIFGDLSRPIPKYTVTIPTYNRPETLKRTIDSALNQVCDVKFDILVVDNNPDPNSSTSEMMNSYKLNENIYYYKNKENLGMFGNWNRMFLLARSEFCTMIHDDDTLEPNYFFEIDKVTVANPSIDVVCVRANAVYESQDIRISKTNIFHNIFAEFEKFAISISKPLKAIDLGYMQTHTLNCACASFIRRECVIKLGGYYCSTKISDQLIGMVLCDQYNTVLLKRPLCNYYISNNESLNKITKIGFVEGSYLYQKTIQKYFKNAYGDWYVQSKLWVALSLLGLAAEDLDVNILLPKYKSFFWRMLYYIVTFYSRVLHLFF